MEDELTTLEVLDGLRIDADDVYATVNDDGKLDVETRADLTRKVDDIIELLDDARKIVATSYATE